MKSRPDAAILVVGAELLSGRVRDENLHFLAEQLWGLGVPVRRAEFCRDDVADIADAVARLARAHTWLFTAGGIGPTHDDVTPEGVARAFGAALAPRPEIEELVRRHFGEQTSPAHLRLALAPEGARLEGGENGAWPTVCMANVYILPGVPEILRRKFARLAERFRQPPLHRRTLAVALEEARLAPALERAAGEHPGVQIGSYLDGRNVLVVLEGEEEAGVEDAALAVSRALRAIAGA